MPHPTNLLYERWQSPLRDGGAVHLTKASTAITKGRPVMVDSNGFIVHWTTGEIPLGIAMEAKASSDTSTTPILIDYIRSGDIFRGTADDVITQTMVGELVDVKSDGTVDVGVTTNDDFRVWNILGLAATDILVTFSKTY